MIQRKLLLATALLVSAVCNAQSIGIGTTTPDASAQLDVSSTAKGMLVPRMTFVQRNAIASPVAGLLIYQTDFSAGFYYYNGSLWTQLNTGTPANYWSLSGSNIYSNNGGNTGIGATTPLEKFHVKGITRIDAAGATGDAVIKMYGATTNDQSYIYFYNSLAAGTPAAYFGYSAPSDYSLWGNGSTTAYLKSEGLGISNTTPLTKLHITGGQDAGFGTNSNGYIMNGAVTGANLVIDNNEILARNNGLKADIFLQADSGNIILCANEQGAVGIGVTVGTSIPAGFLLAVDGKVISEEVKVQLSGNWPDYVFDKKYKLPSFDNLRKYVAVNKHLPNIPAAAELQKNGIELGDMQKRMMEKIEELTLYVLELEKQIQQIKKQHHVIKK